jgi:putative transposase
MARRRGHTEEQILAALRQAESGTTVADICRNVGISEQTFYVWKRKYAGLGLSELRELRQLREENTKLKRLVADLSLDRHMLQEIVRKKLWQDAEKVRQRRSRIAQRLTVPHEYDSPLRSLRPCWTAFLRILRAILIPTRHVNRSHCIAQKSSFSAAC